jgi:hypothetical protein
MVARKIWLRAALAVALAAGPAAALENANGSYEGKLKCKGLAGGDREKTKLDVEVAVHDDGAGNVQLGIETLGTLNGFLLTDTRKPETGTLSAVSCTLDTVDQTGHALQADVKVKAGSEKASLKGKLIRMDRSGETASLCEFKAERVSTTPVKLIGCP